LISDKVPIFMLGPFGSILGSSFCVGAYPMEAVRRCVSVDGAEKIKGSGAPGDLVRLCGECDACFAVTMDGKKGRIMYTCLVDCAPKFGCNGEC
jgi:hypothetical protein